MPAPALKYLFAVRYKDGSVFLQPEADVSAVDPTRSAFFDVRQDEVAQFELSDGEHFYSVDLQDGRFWVNGCPFSAHEDLPLSTDGETPVFRLIFFRRHQQSFNLGMDELSHTVEYHLGWQITINGKNYQQTIRFW